MEVLDTINKRLGDIYGRFESNEQNYRVVWTKDQLEKRFGTFDKISENGLFLGTETCWKEVPKYNYIPPQWVLEKLVPVPAGSDIDVKVSYEPLWGFGLDPFGIPLPYKWEVIEIVITTLHQNLARQNGVAYEEMPFLETEHPEAIKARIDVMEEMLFEKSRIGDRLTIGEGVSLSGAYDKGAKI